MSVRSIRLGLLSACGAAASILSAAHGQVGYYHLYFSQYYNQVTEFAPTAPYAIQAGPILTTFAADDVDSAFMVKPDSTTLFIEPDTSNTIFAARADFLDEASMFAAFPEGLYDFHVAGGTVGDLVGPLQRDEDPFFSVEIPAFTPDTFNALQAGVDVTLPLTIEFSMWEPLPGGTINYTGLQTFATDGSYDSYITFPPSVASYTFDPDTFPAGKRIFFVLYYSARQEFAFAGLGAATSSEVYERATLLGFDTLGEPPTCPADFTEDTFVDDSDFVIFAAAYDEFVSPPADERADFNADGFVDDFDFVVFAAAYDEFVCP